MTKAKAASPQAGRFPGRSSQPDDAIQQLMSMVAQIHSGTSVVTKHLLNCSVRVAVAALCLGAMINGTIAGSFTRGCAERDLQILVLIEERESASDAMVTMMNARMICSGAHLVD